MFWETVGKTLLCVAGGLIYFGVCLYFSLWLHYRIADRN